MPVPPDPHELDAKGFTLARQNVADRTVHELIGALTTWAGSRSDRRYGSQNARGLLETCPAVARLAASEPVRRVVEPAMGANAFVVRGLLFDKVPEANWRVGWHQDLMIPVARRVDTPGFASWSTKQGVTHVRPPAEVLAGMLTLRVHLDDCQADNGPLEVLPGTHRLGIIDERRVRDVVESGKPVICTALAGDVLVMRPLLLHASRPSKIARHRRVVHLEFASQPLPGELEWYRPGASVS